MIVDSDASEYVVRNLDWLKSFTNMKEVSVELAGSHKIARKHVCTVCINF